MHCGKTADRIRIPFGIVGRTGPGIRQVLTVGDRSTGRGTFGSEFGACRCPRGPIGRMCATAALLPNYFGQTCLVEGVKKLESDQKNIERASC